MVDLVMDGVKVALNPRELAVAASRQCAEETVGCTEI